MNFFPPHFMQLRTVVLQSFYCIPGRVYMKRWTIDNLEMFTSAADDCLQLIDVLIERLHHTLPLKSNHASPFGQSFIEIIQHPRVFLIFADAFEQGRSLCDNLAILEQSMAVVRLHLAKPAIEKTPPLFGRTINQAQIVGRE